MFGGNAKEATQAGNYHIISVFIRTSHINVSGVVCLRSKAN